MTDADFGILAVGAYVPKNRLPKTVIADANRWFAPSLWAKADDRRSFCNWDEDALTMAVEAGRAGLAGHDASEVTAIELASTSLPFADRSNAGVVREALDLGNPTRVQDTAGSLRAASTALERLLSTPDNGAALLVASDCVDARPASGQEMSFGHGAAAVLIGPGEPIARMIGSARLHQDFVDHYRASTERFEYALEPRWTRDAGYRDQVIAVLDEALSSSRTSAADVTRLAISAPGGLSRAVGKSLAKTLTTSDSASALESKVGFCGAAQPLLALVDALESSSAGDTVVLVSLGQGVDVLVFQVTRPTEAKSLADAVAVSADEDNYTRYLALRGILPLETGIRAERDNRTSQSAFWRKHEAITAFKGGRCSACGTLQFPPSKICVNCGKEGTQALERLADIEGHVRSFTEDWLAYTPRPPLVFGNVGFRDGANVMMEFTDVEPGQLEVGSPVSMQFRIKDFDERRHFRRYFWKPAPIREAASA